MPEITPPPLPPPRRSYLGPVLIAVALIGFAGLVLAAYLAMVDLVGRLPEMKTTYAATIQSVTAPDPQHISVVLRVTNTGRVAAPPECTASAGSLFNDHHGSGISNPASSLAPGATTTIVVEFTVTNNGARDIAPSDVTASCQVSMLPAQ